jgi:hypothetical protein
MVEIPNIRPDEALIRHVHPNLWNEQEGRPMSAAFSDDELSVDREEMRDVDTSCRLREGSWSFVRFLVQSALDENLTVTPDPIGVDELALDTTPSLEYNPGHAIVLGSRKAKRRLRDVATIVYRPGECPQPEPQLDE